MTLAILQARTTSTRLPGKILRPLHGKPMLARQIERVIQAKHIKNLVVATSNDPSDDPVATLCSELEVSCFRGALNDVLDRFYQAALLCRPTNVVRLTGDCPLTDPEVIDQVIEYFLAGNYDYASNAIEPTFPDGLDVEMFRFDCLETAWREARLPSQREHVTLFIHGQPERFRIGSCRCPLNLGHLRWTVDEPADFEFVSRVYGALYPINAAFRTNDVLALIAAHPELAKINNGIIRNEGLLRSLQRDRESRE